MSGPLQTRSTQQSAQWRVLLGLALLLVASAVDGRAAAVDAPELPVLQWTAPSECPDASQVRERIASLLGPNARSAAAPAVRATGVVSHGRTGYKLVLSVKNGTASGTRRLAGDDCEALSETAAWLVAVTVDPNVPEAGSPVIATPAEPTAAPEPSVPTKPTAPAVAPPVTTQLTPARVAAHWSLLGSAFAGVWQADDRAGLTRAQLGGSLGFGWRMLDVELRGAYALPRDLAIGGGVDVRSATQSYGLASCALFGTRLRAGPCGSASLLITDAESRGVPERLSKTHVWGALGIGGQAAVELIRHFELFLEAGLSKAISRRPAFTFDGAAVLNEREVGVYGRLGLRFRWGLLPPGAR